MQVYIPANLWKISDFQASDNKTTYVLKEDGKWVDESELPCDMHKLRNLGDGQLMLMSKNKQNKWQQIRVPKVLEKYGMGEVAQNQQPVVQQEVQVAQYQPTPKQQTNVQNEQIMYNQHNQEEQNEKQIQESQLTESQNKLTKAQKRISVSQATVVQMKEPYIYLVKTPQNQIEEAVKLNDTFYTFVKYMEKGQHFLVYNQLTQQVEKVKLMNNDFQPAQPSQTLPIQSQVFQVVQNNQNNQIKKEDQAEAPNKESSQLDNKNLQIEAAQAQTGIILNGPQVVERIAKLEEKVDLLSKEIESKINLLKKAIKAVQVTVLSLMAGQE